MATPVWLLATTFEPRGSTQYTLRLARHLVEFGFAPTVVCESAAAIPPHRRVQLDLIEVPRLSHPVLRWLAVRRLARLARDEPPALLHAQRRELDRVALELAEQLEVPYLVTVHHPLPKDATFRILPERLGAVIAVSSSVREDLSGGAAVPLELLRVVPPGVDPPPGLTLPASRGEHEVPVVGCASAMEPAKGLSYFLMAAELILSSGQDAEFLLAGSGPEEETLRRMAQVLDISHRVTFATHVREYRSILDTLDVFVLPSLEQGAGTIMLEAMGLGKPVVATQVGGVSDYVVDGEHALLVPKANHVILAEKIQFLLDHREKARRLATAAQNLVRARFLSEQMARATAEIYQEVLNRQLAPTH